MVGLRPYQEEAADFIYSHDRSLILAKVGAGKTCIALTAMRDYIRDGLVKRWLVIAPKRVAEHVWPGEVKKWASPLSINVAIGTPQTRSLAFLTRSDIVVINYDNLQWLAETYPALSWHFDGVVFDELTKLKNPSGKRFKAFLKVVDGINIRIGLTGSFTSNGLEDVFGQVKVVDQSVFGRSKGAFMQTYFWCANPQFGDWIARPGALGRIMDKVKPITYLLESAEYADSLPPLNIVEMRCQMDMQHYNKMKRDLLLELGDDKIIAANAGVVTAKLQQMACIARGTPVLTERGWVPIESVGTARVWDGVEWVSHSGAIYKGKKRTTVCHGVQMTYNHRVLTVSGWQTAKEILDGKSTGKFARSKVWLPDSYWPRRHYTTQMRDVGVPVRLRQDCGSPESVSTRYKKITTSQLRVSSRKRNSSDVEDTPIQHMDKSGFSVPVSARQRLREVWREGDIYVRTVAERFLRFLGGYVRRVRATFDARPYRQQRAVLAAELPVGYGVRATEQPAEKCVVGYAKRPHDGGASRESVWAKNSNPPCKGFSLWMGRNQSLDYADTFDIVNCGPRNRFVVRGDGGVPLIVHNCGWVYQTDTVATEVPGKFKTTQTPHWFSQHKYDLLEEILEENQRTPTLVWYWYKEDLAELKRRYPQAQTLDDKNIIERWNSGQVEMLLVHPQSAGHGLNLQSQNTMLFFSLPWSLELFEQSIGRLHRSGQHREVWCYVLMTEKTIDELMLGALNDKKTLSEIAVESLKNS